MRVVIDPNVLLSALIAPGGTSDRAVRAAVAGATLIISPQLLQRFVQRAGEERFRRWFSLVDAQGLADELAYLAGLFDDPPEVPAVVADDPSDDYLVALARTGQADRLLTGDQGIRQALADADDLQVVSPAELLDEFPGDAEGGEPDET